MIVEDFLKIADFTNYIVISKDKMLTETCVGKRSVMELCGYDILIKVGTQLELVNNSIKTICVLHIQ